MPSNIIVTFRIPTTGPKRAYVDYHKLPVSKVGKAGTTKIEFKAAEGDGGFVVVIPEANLLFIDPEEPTLHRRVEHGAPYVTPTINDNVNEDEMYEYHVYCEEEGDWAHKRGASPPKIIIEK
jgi:hypothetical protein